MMISTTLVKNDDVLVPRKIAERVLSVGPDHINFRGGIGGVMNVYGRHFSVYKCITTHKPTTHKRQLISFFLKQYGRFVRTLRQDSTIQIVHIQASSHGSFYRKLALFLTAKYAFGKQVIYHMHGSRFEKFYHKSDPVSKFLIRFLVEHADLVIGLSEYWRDFFSRNFRVRRLEVLGNVIHRLDSGKSYPTRVNDGLLRVLFLGAIGQRKGIFDLLDMLREHRDVFEGRLLLRIGGNGETERLLTYIANHKLETLVQFEGWVSGEKKHELLGSSDVYILPSYHEGLPISILEAMNYQLPVIATPVGGTAEAVQEGINGFLVMPGDKDAFRDRLLQFVAQPDLATTMGAASGQLVRRYLPDAIFAQLSNIYESMLRKSA